MAEKKSFLLRLNGQIEFILHEAIRRERHKKLAAAGPRAASGRPKEGT
jgi:hypothetical protein